jgi:hypothetical protein
MPERSFWPWREETAMLADLLPDPSWVCGCSYGTPSLPSLPTLPSCRSSKPRRASRHSHGRSGPPPDPLPRTVVERITLNTITPWVGRTASFSQPTDTSPATPGGAYPRQRVLAEVAAPSAALRLWAELACCLSYSRECMWSDEYAGACGAERCVPKEQWAGDPTDGPSHY